jgi:hypothetical protein
MPPVADPIQATAISASALDVLAKSPKTPGVVLASRQFRAIPRS